MKDTRKQDPLEEAARQASSAEQLSKRYREQSLASRFGAIGVLGWMMVLPTLGGMLAGRWLDRLFQTGIQFSAALTVAGAAIGFWMALRWMREQK